MGRGKSNWTFGAWFGIVVGIVVALSVSMGHAHHLPVSLSLAEPAALEFQAGAAHVALRLSF